MALTSILLSTVQVYVSQHPYIFLISVIPVSLVLYIVINEFTRASLRVPGFDGPLGYPLVGNIPQIRHNASEKYRGWAKKFGPIFQIQLGNIPVLVVNSAAAAQKVFVTNSQATISRPIFYTFHKVVSTTAGFTIGTSPYDESLKRRRKAAASALNRPSVQSYVPHIDLETKEFIKDAFEIGGKGMLAVDPLPLIQRLSLNLSLTLNWGTRIDSVNDPLFHEITEVEEYVSRFRSTTGNKQDYIPLLRLNPFSGQSALAKNMRARRDVYLSRMNRELDERIAKMTYKPCIQASVLLDSDAKLDSTELMSISLTMVSGGLDTITTLVAWSLPLLAKRPDIQKKAYAAIREFFTERDVLCDPVEDQKCAYIVALVRELLRLYTPLRLALPRAAERDFFVDGKLVPKGTVIFLNAWACNMDPDVWPDPEEFRPERFLEKSGGQIFTYGQGSRMCAGYMLGNRELYLLFMRIISAFEILEHEPVDIDPLTGLSDPTSLVSTPKQYKVIFRPRDPDILEEALRDHVSVMVDGMGG
ncbi:cytochrome P450 [Lipomyces kononenkoae]|uniref:Cytochrome P450 n=1 Tax=Lipomyces kononenkoae TaxID=34357 RepID=A0ACC3T7W4_LIPKO